jgi:sugar phosphate permease
MQTTLTTAGAIVPVTRTSSLYSKWQWHALIGVTFCYLFYYTGRQTFGFAIPGIQAEFGFTKQSMGWISAAMLWGYAVGQSINGNLGDKFGGKRMMVAGAILSFAANWAFSFAGGFISMLLIWCANGFFQSMGFAPGSRLLSNWWGQERRGFVYGIYVGFSGFSSVIAFALPILILGPLGLTWHSIFRIPVFFMLLGALALWLFVREKPEDLGLRSPSEERGSTTLAADDDDSTSRGRYVAVLRSWRLYVTGISIGCQNAARYALIVWVPVHLLGKHWTTAATGGISPTWITLALPIGMALGAITNGWVSDVVFKSRRYVAIIVYMLVASVLAIAMAFFAHGDVVGLVLMFLCGFFVFGPASSFWALCPDLFGRKYAGTATGLLNCMSYAAGIGEPLIGRTMDMTGQTGIIFPIVAGLCVASAISAYLIKK